MMTSKEILNAALFENDTTQAFAAELIGWTPQQLSQRMVRNSLRADEFLAILEALDVDVKLTSRKTGAEIKPFIQGAGRRAKGMADRVIYDTAYADALSNSFYANGVNKYSEGKASELYIDREGRYFIVEYTEDVNEKDKIRAVGADIAASFIELHGTKIFKQPES